MMTKYTDLVSFGKNITESERSRAEYGSYSHQVVYYEHCCYLKAGGLEDPITCSVYKLTLSQVKLTCLSVPRVCYCTEPYQGWLLTF